MMQNILLVLFVLALGAKSSENHSGILSSAPAAEEVQKNMLIGEFSREDLEQKPFSRWFNRGYKKYRPEEKSIKIIKENIQEYEIVCVMATWCRDSRREIPHLYKILDEAGYETNRISGTAVDWYNGTPENVDKELNVKIVPTIIFFKHGIEVNRIVEFPVESLEEDLANIVSQKDYKNSYADF